MWADVSGTLSASTFAWADQGLQPGEAASYRVEGENADGLGQPSATATGTRAVQDPQVGSMDVLTADQDPGGQPIPSWSSDHFSTDVTVSTTTVSGSGIGPSSLSSPDMSFAMPALLPGPGVYQVDDSASSPTSGSTIQVSAPPNCGDPTGQLKVAEVMYTPDWQLATFAGQYRLDCPDGTSTYGEVRWHSTLAYADLEVTPSRPNAGFVPVGQASAPLALTLTNRGTTPEALGAREITAAAAADWQISGDTCPDILAAGSTCTVDVQGTPSTSGIRAATLQFTDSTARGVHRAALAMTGTSPPSVPTNVKALRLPGGGIDLSWDPPADLGGTNVQRYVVHRFSQGVETRVDVPADAQPSWVDTGAAADATYSVSAVNETGEGAASSAILPSPVEEPLFVTSSLSSQSVKMGVVAQPSGTRVVPWTAIGDGTGYAASIALSPDGTSLLSTQPAATGWVLWREPVDRSSAPVKLWTSSGRLGRARWSPDGTRVAVVSSDATSTVLVLNATTGAQVLSIPSFDQPDWLPDSRTLVGLDVTVQGRPLIRVSAVTGQRLGQLTGTLGAVQPSVSPDGRWIAFGRAAYDTAGTFLLPLAGGTPRQIATTPATDLSWQPGSHALAVVHPFNFNGVLSLVSVSDDGTTGQLQDVTLREYPAFYSVAWGGQRVSIAPSPAVTGPSASFGLNTAPLPAGTTYICAVDSRSPIACGATFSASALATGAHTMRVWSRSPSGLVTVATRTFSSDATPPAARMITPTAAVTTGGTLTASYAATDASGVSSYDVRYRRAGWNGVFSSYAAWTNATKNTSVSMPLPAGYRYCVSVRARDVYGNVSAWTADRCTARPVDDRSLGAATAGWTRTTNTAFYLGTATYSTRSGAALTLGNVGTTQVYLLATTCVSCGSVAVYIGATKVGSASLYATRTSNQVLITLPVTAMHTGTLRIVVASPSGRLVRIDGVSVRST
jgi:WD40 repeat protein